MRNNASMGSQRLSGKISPKMAREPEAQSKGERELPENYQRLPLLCASGSRFLSGQPLKGYPETAILPKL
jgi:hypothetical protein